MKEKQIFIPYTCQTRFCISRFMDGQRFQYVVILYNLANAEKLFEAIG